MTETKTTSLSNTLIRDLVANAPQTMPVLASYGLDLCCGGGHSLSDACKAHELDYAQVVADLEAVMPHESSEN